jgi:hypothetical protein
MRSVRAFLILIIICAAATPALAYGPATHSAVSAEAARRLARDPRFAFLARPELEACVRWGATFPDVREMEAAVARGGARFEAAKKKLEATIFVERVDLSTDEVVPLGFDTHDRAFALFLLEKADASGDLSFRAFAMGWLAHIAEDVHAKVFLMPHVAAATGAADVGLRPVEDPAAPWSAGEDLDQVFNTVNDARRPAADAVFLRDARARIAPGSPSDVLHRVWLAMKEWHDAKLGLAGFISERGFRNLAELWQAALVAYPYGIGRESAGGASRELVRRYVVLPWWVKAIEEALDILTRVFTLDRLDIFRAATCVAHADRRVESALASDPVYDVIWGALHGDASARARHASNVELQRLVASGLLDPTTYATLPEDDAAELARALVADRGASRWADPAQWPVFDLFTFQAGAVGGLCELMGPGSGYREEPGLSVFRARFVDPATALDVTRLKYPDDVGRALRLEVELFAPVADALAAQGRDVTVAVKEDRGLGRANPEVARATAHVPGSQLVPTLYGTTPRPKLALDLVAPADAGEVGLYLELDAGRGVFFTSDASPFAALTAGRPQYAKIYATYSSPFPPAVKIVR